MVADLFGRPSLVALALAGALPLSTAAALSAHGQEAPPGAAIQDSEQALMQQVRGPSDADEIESFLEGLMSAHLKDKTIVGATVSVVRDGRVLYSGGFGKADLESDRAVDPDRTLFRIGSVSKLFTWIAVMQQVEEGNLSLDDDVNEHLDFEIPEAFGEPIRIWHLLTHTPGLEDRGMGLFGPTDLSRRDYLAANLPARVRPPGTLASYSNYGTSLAGHIVENLGGMSWEEYIEVRIMRPLGMEYATGRQPLPDELAPHMSTGYSNGGGWVSPEDFEVIGGQAPAGSVSASAGAMAKFMIAILQNGQLGEAAILRPETMQLMLTRRHGHDDRLNGYGLGFYEKSANGVRILGHGGDTQWFHSDMSVMPEENVGVFVSYNTAAGGQLSFANFLSHFLNHYYPSEGPAPIELEEEALEDYEGTYRFTRGSFTTFEKAMGLAGWPTIDDSEDGALVMGETRYLPIGNDEFIEQGGNDRLLFHRDEAENVTRAFMNNVPMMVLERMPALAAPSLHQSLLLAAILVFILALVGVPVRWYLRRRYGEQDSGAGLRARRARRLGLSLAALNVMALIGLGVVISNAESLFTGGGLGALRFVLALFMISALLTIVVVWQAIQSWRLGSWSLWGRIRYSGFAALAVVFILILNYWNLLGWKLG